MDLFHLPPTTTRSRKRLGRGYGSGKGGHTVGRGTKGQGARSKVTDWFEGGQLPTVRRFPFIRGKSRFKSQKPSTITLNLSQLNRFPAQSNVNIKSLVAAKLVKTAELKSRPVKILGHGKLSVALNVFLPTTKSAATKIIAAGGKVNRGQTQR